MLPQYSLRSMSVLGLLVLFVFIPIANQLEFLSIVNLKHVTKGEGNIKLNFKVRTRFYRN